ncbi:S8 family serine peptidase [Primorskyibacter sp. 2E233]|uniref:S8 family serine peptidase n=1 Tax=Primorskyibacter sp. 2E233 TaxID=3413431 RepID=UPI003BF3736B
MTRFIVLRDRSGNWRRPAVPSLNAIEPTRPDEPAEPEITTVELSPKYVDEIEKDPSFLGVSPVVPTRLLAPEPMDELRADELVPGWGQSAIGADRTQYTGKGARIALLDTGIDTQHPAFAKITPMTRDYAGTGIEDANGHGTHVAGTVLGRDMGGMRIGVARGVTSLLVGKALTDSGHGRSEDFLRALLWARDQKADVIGFSLAFDTAAHIEMLTANGYPMTLATMAAVHAYRGNLRIFENLLGMMDPATRPLVMGAIGNDCLRTISPEFETGPAAPSAARGVLTIGALGPGSAGFSPAPFSNIGPSLMAPGVGIVSASAGDGVRSMNGSSMALAHGLGVAALWAEHMRETGQKVNAQTLATNLVSAATTDGLSPHLTLFERGQGLIQAPRSTLE